MRSSDVTHTGSSSRTISPYVVSLVAMPALLAPVSVAASQATQPIPVVTQASMSVSQEGMALDRIVAAARREIEERTADLDRFIPDLTFVLRPSRRTHHTARVVLRHAALPYAGGPTDFTPLD